MLTLRAFPMPLAPFTTMRRELDSLFNELADWSGPARVFPALNVWEDGDRLVAEAETPGYRLEDLEITVEQNMLTIRGVRAESPEAKNVTVHRRERMDTEFSRSLSLPFEVDAEKVEATLRDGVLTIILPKAEAARARRIAVKQG